jgi:hypothetical protein
MGSGGSAGGDIEIIRLVIEEVKILAQERYVAMEENCL